GWIAKGSMEVTENIIEGIVKNYTIYLALYSYKNSIYEIVMVGQGKGLDYKKEAFQIINSVRFNANNNKIIWKSHGLKIMDLDEWVSKSTKKNEIISWTHNKEPVILIISFNKKIKGKQDFKTEVKKAINDFRVYLIKISYKYEDFEIITGSVSKENTRAVVFHAVGKMNNKKIGVRKYYFTNKNHLYDVEIWYSKKDWEEGISKIVDKTLKSIEFER
ncbi:MAG: hypothetical protein OEV44_14530, partial [Spirochaetota bacterium]|nr:hypothetical protein [Spirochaetota bacterium]